MKALSLHQPYAQAVIIGSKTIETRSWATKHTGDVLICSTKLDPYSKLLRRLLISRPFVGALRPLFGELHPHQNPQLLPLGHALAVVRLTQCVPTKELMGNPKIEQLIREDHSPTGPVPEWLRLLVGVNPVHPNSVIDRWSEWELGNYVPGRFGWLLEDVRPLRKPFPVRGMQRLFDVDDELIQAAL